MIQITIIAAATLVFLVLERDLPRRERPEAARRHVRTAFPKGCQVAIVLLAGVLLFVFLDRPNLGAQPFPLQGQSAAQKKDAAVEAATPSDSVTVPDGTPLTLELEEPLTSGTAKVGDTVKFTTLYPARINGFVIAPKGTAVSGTVAQVNPPRRASIDGQVKVAIKEMVLPSGELVTLRPRKSANKKSKSNAMEIAPHVGAWTRASERTLGDATPAVLLMLLAAKGDEWLYPAGARTTVYFNGPQHLNRGALVNLQPLPYKGPAQVFFKNRRRKAVKLFCGQKLVGDLFYPYPIRLELSPGNYSFTTGKAREKATQLEVHEDHQYWIGLERKGLLVKDSQQHRDEIEGLEGAWGIGRDFTSSTMADSCALAALP